MTGDAGCRVEAMDALANDAAALVAACADIAARVASGGRLLALSAGADADAAHIAVEFLHPVMVGKPAIPSLAVDPESATRLRRAGDVVVTVGTDTIEIDAGGARHAVTAATDDPFVAREVVVTAYHLLWEQTHLLLAPEPPADASMGASLDALYPMLAGGREVTAEDLVASTVAKVHESRDLRIAAITAERDRLATCARAIAESVAAGGTVISFGNGGSATDASAFARLLRSSVPAVSLTDDSAVVTALANDLGYDLVFSRQLEALARGGDVAVAFSTSGSSTNLLRAVDGARRSGLVTVGFAGGGGGAMAGAGLDHLFVVPSASVHRIQEVHVTLGHVLVRLVE